MDRDPPPFAFPDPPFLAFALVFEAALAAVGVGIAWAASVPLDMSADAQAVAVGVGATLPLIGFYLVTARLRARPLRRIHDLLVRTLGGPLARCRWYELALLPASAGICEELLFRGAIQPWIGRLGEPAGWVGANALFGLVHAVTPTYALLAAAIGVYLSAVQAAAGGSLVAAVLTHGLYDLFAFVMIAREHRRRGSGGEPPQAPNPRSGRPDD